MYIHFVVEVSKFFKGRWVVVKSNQRNLVKDVVSWMYVPNEDVFLLYTKSLCIWMPQTKSTRSANLLFASLLFCRLWNAHYTWTKDEWKQNNKSLKLITRLRRKRREKELLVIIPVWIIVVTVCFSGYHFPFLTSQSGKHIFLVFPGRINVCIPKRVLNAFAVL